MDKCHLFQKIAEEVWDLIARNHRRGSRQHEEGVTRIKVVDAIQNYVEDKATFEIFAQKARDEVNTGGDLELFLEEGYGSFRRVFLQAKVCELDGCFENLNRESGSTGRKQYDTLDAYAKRIQSRAFYVFYNGHHTYRVNDEDCAGPHNEKQFGCAIVNVDTVRKHCEETGSGCMAYDNYKPIGSPWRFLSCCGIDYSGTRLYTKEEIDMDSHFDRIFTEPPPISFMTVDEFKQQSTTLETRNEQNKKDGWRPTSRIFITKNTKMKRAGTLIAISPKR